MILGASILQLPAIQKANKMGLQVIAVDMNPDAIGFKEKNVISEVISTIDIDAVLQVAKKHKINGIMTLASDMPMRTVAIVAKELNLIGISEETAIKATNKVKMRDALYENNVPCPVYFKVNEKEEYKKSVNQIKNMNCKCIVKPADNSGSRGIYLISSYEENEIDTAFKYSKRYSRDGDILVEEYMEGPEVSVETLSIDGKCNVIQITDKLTTGAPYFVEIGHSQPSKLDIETKKKIKEIAIAANHAIGIDNGPSHTEIKITPNGPKIVELGARLGGDNITTHLVPLSTGVDMVECCINIALGKKADFKIKYNKGSAIKYFNQNAGKIISINGIKEASTIEGVQQIVLLDSIGSHINEIKSSNDRIGYVIANADNADSAINICDKVLNSIKIHIE